ncbi:cysteine hydrolase family protein [Christensenella intestinihominis]|uniref:cysteine hydrolase family protein n=1 Tax=Christensenella intestinihominis TaxID=1851429 RepID=UPI00082A7695|nr:isochorismatase family protein [Christensenella intestinihominis]
MDCLLVIDMQEDYVGAGRNKKRYPYNAAELIENVNKRICEYSPEAIVYVTNRFFWENTNTSKKLAETLSVHSGNIYEKRKASCFSNKALLAYLESVKAERLELVGVDGNHCIAGSALDGVKKGFTILCNESCVGTADTGRYKRIKEKLKKKNVQFIE